MNVDYFYGRLGTEGGRIDLRKTDKAKISK